MASEQYRKLYGPSCPPHAGDRWMLEADDHLVSLIRHDHFIDLRMLAAEVGRTEGAVTSRMGVLVTASGLNAGNTDWGYARLCMVIRKQSFYSYWQRVKQMEDVADEEVSDKFWMVQGVGTSRVRHTTLPKAKAEAARLAAKDPGTKFFIMEAVEVAETVPRPRVQLRKL